MPVAPYPRQHRIAGRGGAPLDCNVISRPLGYLLVCDRLRGREKLVQLLRAEPNSLSSGANLIQLGREDLFFEDLPRGERGISRADWRGFRSHVRLIVFGQGPSTSSVSTRHQGRSRSSMTRLGGLVTQASLRARRFHSRRDARFDVRPRRPCTYRETKEDMTLQSLVLALMFGVTAAPAGLEQRLERAVVTAERGSAAPDPRRAGGQETPP